MQYKFAPILHPKITHLSSDDLKKLIGEYYDGKSIKSLIIKYKLDIKENNLLKYFPPIIIKDKFCIYCKTSLWKKLDSKYNIIRNKFFLNKAYCPNCGHKEDEKYCKCENCRISNIEQQNIQNKNKTTFNDEHLNNSDSLLLNYEDLNFKERVFLSSIISLGLSDNNRLITLYQYKDYPIAPTYELMDEMLNSLTQKQILSPKIENKFDFFDNYQRFNQIIYNRNVQYYVNINGLTEPAIFQSNY